MEVFSNLLANPMVGVIVFAVIWTCYYVEKNFLVPAPVNNVSKAVNMNPVKAVQAIEEAEVVEEVVNEMVLEEV